MTIDISFWSRVKALPKRTPRRNEMKSQKNLDSLPDKNEMHRSMVSQLFSLFKHNHISFFILKLNRMQMKEGKRASFFFFFLSDRSVPENAEGGTKTKEKTSTSPFLLSSSFIISASGFLPAKTNLRLRFTRQDSTLFSTRRQT